MRLLVLFLARHQRQTWFLPILLLLVSVVLLALGSSVGLPGWLPLLVLSLWAIIASYDIVVFPGLRGVLRQAGGVVVLTLGIFALVMSIRLMNG